MIECLVSYDPSTGDEVWRGSVSSPAACDETMRRARAVFANWARRDADERSEIARTFAGVVRARRSEISAVISAEVGKPPFIPPGFSAEV